MKVTIVSETSVPSPDPMRAKQLDTLVFFSKDNGEHDAVIVTGTNPSDDQVTAAINAHIGATGARVGRTYEV